MGGKAKADPFTHELPKAFEFGVANAKVYAGSWGALKPSTPAISAYAGEHLACHVCQVEIGELAKDLDPPPTRASSAFYLKGRRPTSCGCTQSNFYRINQDSDAEFYIKERGWV